MARRNSPVSIALASDAGRRALWVLGLIAVGKALGLVLVADGLSRGIVDLFGGVHDAGTMAAIAVAALGALVRALCAWASSTTGARAAVRVREATREGLVARVLSGSGRDTGMSDGALTLLATRSLDDFDDYFTKVLPALTTTAAIPALLVARILVADWVSALVLVLTLPLVPIFMILIGTYTADRVDHAQTALDRLSTHLVELARGLPVLVGLGRVRAQTAALRRVTRTYRDTTMQTLRVAFLSALALELLSTISVAVVAVFIGVRLVHGGMELQDGLFALVLAPECFLPLRRLGAAFHSTENGMRAFRRAKDVTDAPVAPPLVQNAGPSAPGFSFADLTVAYPGREGAALEGFTGSTGPGLTVLRGASGAGKSTLLGVLTGLVRQENDQVVTGTVTGPTALAHSSQAPRTSEETIGEELALHVGDPQAREAALAAAGLDLPPSTPCAELSPGELRRLALARAFGRVLDGTAEALLV
ncbi:ABC transporter transmembrane domain-containing protein, partial [Brevibacterium samyangense]